MSSEINEFDNLPKLFQIRLSQSNSVIASKCNDLDKRKSKSAGTAVYVGRLQALRKAIVLDRDSWSTVAAKRPQSPFADWCKCVSTLLQRIPRVTLTSTREKSSVGWRAYSRTYSSIHGRRVIRCYDRFIRHFYVFLWICVDFSADKKNLFACSYHKRVRNKFQRPFGLGNDCWGICWKKSYTFHGELGFVLSLLQYRIEQ